MYPTKSEICKKTVKKLETTIVQRIEVIDQQSEEIENMAKQVTKKVALGGVQVEGHPPLAPTPGTGSSTGV